MTVRELIKELKRVSPDAEVVTDGIGPVSLAFETWPMSATSTAIPGTVTLAVRNPCNPPKPVVE